MTGSYWYICIAILGIGTAAFTIYKKRHIYKVSTLIVFYIFAACITWIGEFIALGIFNGYHYKPGLLQDPWAENIAGHLLLNTTIWPAAAILMIGCSLGYGWMSLIVAFFIFLEYFFSRLGIYEQYWWRYYMSVIIVAAFLIIAKKWFGKMTASRHWLTRATTLYFVAFVVIHLHIPILLLADRQFYHFPPILNLVGNSYLSSTIFIFIYQLLECFLIIYFVCVRNNWYWKLVPFAAAVLEQILLNKMNILVFQKGWSLINEILLYSISLLVFILIERHYVKLRSHR